MIQTSSSATVPSRTRVKLCGMTREQDVETAIEAGVDALGFICYPPSPRHVEVHHFHQLSERMGPFVTVVAVVVNPDADYLRELLDHVEIDVLQFHGNEPSSYCDQWGKPWIKAARVGAGTDINAELIEPYTDARGWLVDTFRKEAVGGTGHAFDWQLLRSIETVHRQRLVLAGGLNVDNIAAAISEVRPFAVDISSGAEVEPGIKSAQQIGALMTAVRSADADADCDQPGDQWKPGTSEMPEINNG